MGLVRKVILSCVSKQMAADMEAESRAWKLKCSCGNVTNIWDIGGIRYKAYSRGKKTMIRCSSCGKIRWHDVYKEGTAEDPLSDRRPSRS